MDNNESQKFLRFKAQGKHMKGALFIYMIIW